MFKRGEASLHTYDKPSPGEVILRVLKKNGTPGVGTVSERKWRHGGGAGNWKPEDWKPKEKSDD